MAPSRAPSAASVRTDRRSARGSRPRRRTQPRSRFRVLLVWLLLLLAMAGLVARLAYLQLFMGPVLQEISQQQQARAQDPPPARRAIVDRQGNLLAADRIAYTLYGHPALFRQPVRVVAETLAPLLDEPAAALIGKLTRQATGVRLVDGISQETARRIQQFRLDGIELVSHAQRFYPQQELFAPVVGFVDLEGTAQMGLEMSQKARLLVPESAQAARPQALLPVADFSSAPSTALQITLDQAMQRVAQEALQETVRQFGAKRGTVMVMDVHTGALRAMAVAPTFDPNRYFEADINWLKNWAVTDLYEPGSTLKPVNIAIALETEAVQPADSVYDEGQVTIGGWTIQNSDYESTGRRGSLSITEVLKYSSNVGMVHVMDQLSADTYYTWLQKLAIDEPTGIDLPAEVAGSLKDRDQFVNSPVDAATVAFGQGVAMTPLKLLQLQAAIANGGKLVTPHVVSGLVDEDGTLQWQPPRSAPEPVFSPETAATVLRMMEAVVEDGTGKAAQVPGYRIAGKTGTAQKVTEFGSYGSGRVTSFVGILPAEAPRFVVLAVIDEPQGENAYGGTVAAPLVQQVMESLVVLEGIPPASPQAFGGIFVPQDDASLGNSNGP